ncbi:MAG TPA: HAMP domain-containing protein, partial [Dehalococcoidia bacterium]|nr:HAMP domain-containing protein [Dehalococcoidia bacterium]
MRPVALTFRVKVALLLSGVFLLLGVIAALQAREDMKQVLGAELEGRGVAIAHDLAASSADPLLTSDLFGLYELVNRTKLHNPLIRYVLVLGGSGEVKVNTFGSGIPQGLRKANLLSAGEREQLRRLRTEEGLILDIAVPILGGELGTVRVGMSGQRVQAAVAGFSRNLALVALLVAAAGFAISYWLAYYLTRPLSQLLKAVRLVTTGDLSQRISTPGRDEVGQLASAFNAMTMALAQQQAASEALL